MIQISINGECHEFSAGKASLEEIVQALGLEPKTLLIEHNGDALTRAEWEGRKLTNGDSLEILRIAAGG